MVVKASRDIFISYSRDDLAHANKLDRHLAEFKNAHNGAVFIDYKGVEAGDEWRKEIYGRLESADVIVIMISDHYINSIWCLKEAALALERHNNNQAKVFPILISECAYQNFVPPELTDRKALGDIQACGPFDGDNRLKAIELWEHVDTAWTQIVHNIYKNGFNIDVKSASSSIKSDSSIKQPGEQAEKLREVIAHCDRERQCTKLIEFIDGINFFHRPFYAVACCCQHDYPQQFVQRFMRESSIFNKSFGTAAVGFPLLDPVDIGSISNEKISSIFLKHLYRGHNDTPRTTTDVVNKIQEHPAPKIFWQILDTDDLTLDDAHNYISRLAAFLKTWPDLRPASRVLVLTFFSHGRILRSDFANFCASTKDISDELNNNIDINLTLPDQMLVPFTALPVFTPIKRLELVGWLQKNYFEQTMHSLGVDIYQFSECILEQHDQFGGLPLTQLLKLMKDHTGIPVAFNWGQAL